MFKKQKPAELPVPKIIKKPAPPPPVPPKESSDEQPAAEKLTNFDEKSINENNDSEKSKATIQEASKTTISTVQDENTQVTDSFVSVSFATGKYFEIRHVWTLDRQIVIPVRLMTPWR